MMSFRYDFALGQLPKNHNKTHRDWLCKLVAVRDYVEPADIALVMWLGDLQDFSLSEELLESGLLLWRLMKDQSILVLLWQKTIQAMKAVPLSWHAVSRCFLDAYLESKPQQSLTVNKFMYLVGATLYAVHKIYVVRRIPSPLPLQSIALLCSPSSNLIETGIITVYSEIPILDPMVRRKMRQRLQCRQRLRSQWIVGI
jgi:hypothetical protein